MTHTQASTEEMYERIDTHVEDAQGRQVWQYKNKPNWDILTEIEAERTQELENVLWQMLTERCLENSVGVQVDRFGEYVNVERNDLNDDDYKELIRLAINTLRAAGQVNVLIFNLASLTGLPASDLSLLQIYPLTLFMHILVDDFGDFTAEELVLINDVMQNLRIGGASLQLGLQLKTSAFILSDNPAGGPAGTGFATLPDGSDGGTFVRNIEHV